MWRARNPVLPDKRKSPGEARPNPNNSKNPSAPPLKYSHRLFNRDVPPPQKNPRTLKIRRTDKFWPEES